MNMDKLEQFIQMLDEPDRYSDEQWQQQLSDTELGDAYAMMVMTAALMDLRPEDERVVHIILQDCGIEDGDAA